MNARFQFFYSHSGSSEIPGFARDIPTRDVLNTHGQDNKAEPQLEKNMENWCSCRPRQIAWAVREAESSEDPHFLILTTRHPTSNRPIAVGYLEFDKRRYGQ